MTPGPAPAANRNAARAKQRRAGPAPPPAAEPIDFSRLSPPPLARFSPGLAPPSSGFVVVRPRAAGCPRHAAGPRAALSAPLPARLPPSPRLPRPRASSPRPLVRAPLQGGLLIGWREGAQLSYPLSPLPLSFPSLISPQAFFDPRLRRKNFRLLERNKTGLSGFPRSASL